MTDRMPAAFVTSLALHGLVVAVLMLMAYSMSAPSKQETKIFELVAGEGDNFAATVAPALGVPGGIKLTVSTPPQPEPPKPEVAKIEPEPIKPEPTPIAPAPPVAKATPPPLPETKQTAPPATVPTKTKTIAEQMRWEAIKAESKMKQQAAREKAAEKKRMEKEQLDKARQTKVAAANAPRVDVDGIRKGVLGGSTANREGGAGGKALTATEGSEMEKYFAMLRERLVRALDKPPGLSDTLVAEVEFRIGADGSVTGVRIISDSGSAEFNRALLDAYARVRMPVRPDGKSSVHSLKFRTKDLAGG